MGTAALLLLAACSAAPPPAPAPAPRVLTARPAPEWTALFERRTGWLAADGLYSIPRPDGSTLLLFSDTILGDGHGDRIDGLQFLNNTVAVLDGTAPDPAAVAFHWRGGAGDTQTVFVPRTPSADAGSWYWLGDGFVNPALGDTTYVFAYRMRRTDADGIFNFAPDGVALLALPPDDPPPFRRHVQRETPFFVPAAPDRRERLFGSGVFVNTEAAGAPAPDGYVYVYGIDEAVKGLLVARVRPAAFGEFDAWRFWNGQGWTAEMAEAAVVTTRISNELSVTPLADGRYLLVFQLDTAAPDVAARVGATPYGPFGEVQTLYRCPEAEADLGDLDLFCYNAKAHPHLSPDGRLLVSYNVNAFGGGLEALALAHRYYRPRFIWVELGEE